jgi:hypothetical protein
MSTFAVYKLLDERDSCFLATTNHPSFPRKRESTKSAAPRLQSEAIYRITLGTSACRYSGPYIVLLVLQ